MDRTKRQNVSPDLRPKPHGGRASGYGRFGGHAGINKFTKVNWISVEDPEPHYPL